MGTYYVITDVSAYKDKIPEKFYFRYDRTEERSSELDRALFRFFMTEGVGFIP